MPQWKSVIAKQKQEGVGKLLVAFKTDSRKAPRHDYSIMKDGKEIGKVTSGSFSPALSCGIGLGYVARPYAEIGKKVLIKGGLIEIEAAITDKPFYKKSSRRD